MKVVWLDESKSEAIPPLSSRFSDIQHLYVKFERRFGRKTLLPTTFPSVLETLENLVPPFDHLMRTRREGDSARMRLLASWQQLSRVVHFDHIAWHSHSSSSLLCINYSKTIGKYLRKTKNCCVWPALFATILSSPTNRTPEGPCICNQRQS